MNVLFVLYGDFASNSVNPMMLHARELRRRGHRCAIAIPSGLETIPAGIHADFHTLTYDAALAEPGAIFADGASADIVHAWTPREGVRRFVTSYLSRRPAPLVMYLEDNEGWIARRALGMVGLHEEVLLQHSEDVISQWTPTGLAHA